MQDLAGRTAVITGAASGIGAGIAQALADAGMHLVLADVEAEPLARVAHELESHGTRVLPMSTDVTDRDAVFALADTAYREMGTVDVLCSNAGVGSFPPIAEATGADWDWVLSVNVGGMVNCLLAFLPRMKDPATEAHVVLTASIAGLAPIGMTIYSATKYAIVAAGESLAQESATHGYGIGVSILCPGGVDTNFSSSARNRPERHANAAGAEYPTSRSGGSVARPGATYEPMDPVVLGRLVRRAIRDGDLYVLPHPHLRELVDARHARLRAAFARASQDLHDDPTTS